MSLQSARELPEDAAVAEAKSLYARLSRSSTPRGLGIRLAELEEAWDVLGEINPYRVPQRMAHKDPRQCLSTLKYQLLEYWLRLDVELVVRMASQGQATLYELVRALDAAETDSRNLAEFLGTPKEVIDSLRNRLLAAEVEKVLAHCADDSSWMTSQSEIASRLQKMDIWHDFWPEDGPAHVAEIAERVADECGDWHRYNFEKLAELR